MFASVIPKKKNIVFVGIVSLIIIGGVIVAWYLFSSHPETLTPQTNSEASPSPIPSTPTPSFKALDEKDVSLYELSKADQLIPSTIKKDDARPTKLFYLQESKDGFTPSQLVVSHGDKVRIQFTAVDDAYDLAFAVPIGAYIAAAQGGSTFLGFDTKYIPSGIYTFVCQKSCPKNYAQGILVIK